MRVTEAILGTLGIPPGVIRASDACLRLPIDGLPNLEVSVIVPPDQADAVADAIAAACKDAGVRLTVNIQRMEGGEERAEQQAPPGERGS